MPLLPPTSHFRRVNPRSTPAMAVDVVTKVVICLMMIWLTCFLCGCTGSTHSTVNPIHLSRASATQPITRLVFHMDTQACDATSWMAWKTDADARFPGGYVMIVGHGYDLFGQWVVMPSADVLNPVRPFAPLPVPLEFFTQCLRSDYPSLPIILIVCNAEHDRIDVSNVYYADDKVWVAPDDVLDASIRVQRHLAYPGVVGDFDRMIHNQGVHK